MILGYKQKVDPASGIKVYDADGSPVRSDVFEDLGNGIAKFNRWFKQHYLPGNNSDLMP